MTTEGAPYELIGPFEHYDIVVDGRRVPFLEGEPANGGRIFLHLDRRMCVDISVQDAERVVPFIADCIAVAMGYTAFPRASEGMDAAHLAQPFPRMKELGGPTAGDRP